MDKADGEMDEEQREEWRTYSKEESSTIAKYWDGFAERYEHAVLEEWRYRVPKHVVEILEVWITEKGRETLVRV